METFKISIEKSKISDLKNRIKNTRWIKESENPLPGNSLEVKSLKSIADYWANQYDWEKQEQYLNSFKQYKIRIDNTDIHFVYEKGNGTKRIPVLFLHGWAGCFTQFLKVVELFKKKNPEIDVIVPSHPAFGFSGIPDTPVNSEIVSAIMHKLMTGILGYQQYYIHGSDFGSFVGERIALDYPQSVKGLHLTDIPYYHLYGYNENLSEEETRFIEKINMWSMQDGAYSGIQGAKPKILATALNDSPLGLAAWLLQLYDDFSDKSKSLEAKYNKDELFTNVSIYWFTETIYSSMRIYSEDTHGFGEPATRKIEIPVGFCFYPFDISGTPPRAFVNRFFSNIISWTEQKTGGHFGSIEYPSLLHTDLVRFIKMVER